MFVTETPELLTLHTGQVLECPTDMLWCFDDGNYYERNVEHWLISIISKVDGCVFYDIGANIGSYALVSGRVASRTYCFEPSSRTREILIRNLKQNGLNGLVDVFDCGLSERSGTAELNIYSSCGNNSFVRRILPEGHALTLQGTETVRIIPLDDLVRERRLRPPSLIKIDVEGGELAVLRGAEETVRTHRPVLLFEYSEATSRDAGHLPEALLDVITPLDYEFRGLPADTDDLALVHRSEWHLRPVDNVLAVPRERALEFFGADD